ncbi:MAG: DUF4174 domain-containing protein [Pseudomonadota bacterium]
MKTIWNIAAAGLTALLPGILQAQDASLHDHRWTHRPILVFAHPDDPRLEIQLDRFDTAGPELDDRDNILIVDTAKTSALRDRFRPATFTVILVGKDGGEKFRRDGLVEPAELSALIDTMPMRRQEMQRQ